MTACKHCRSPAQGNPCWHKGGGLPPCHGHLMAVAAARIHGEWGALRDGAEDRWRRVLEDQTDDYRAHLEAAREKINECQWEFRREWYARRNWQLASLTQALAAILAAVYVNLDYLGSLFR
jgi:hypothetical protein